VQHSSVRLWNRLSENEQRKDRPELRSRFPVVRTSGRTISLAPRFVPNTLTTLRDGERLAANLASTLTKMSRANVVRQLRFLAVVCLLAELATAQGGISGGSVDPSLAGAETHGDRDNHSNTRLIVDISLEDRARLDRQAVVKLTNRATHNVTWQASDAKSEATFYELGVGDYDVEISAVGYLTQRHDLRVQSLTGIYPLDVKLKPDSSSVDLTVTSAAKMPSKARKEALRGLDALKSANLKDAQKELEGAYKIAPASADVNFLLGYLFYQKKIYQQAETYLNAAVTLDPRHAQALILLGRVQLQNKENAAAAKTFEQAVAVDPGNWTAHNLLAEIYLKQSQFEKARQQAELAIEKGRDTDNPGRLLLAAAQADMGDLKPAIETLQAFLKAAPQSSLAPQARQLIVEISRAEDAPASQTSEKLVPSVSGMDQLLASAEPSVSIQGWEPPGIDDAIPPVAAGATCPFDDVIAGTESGVKQLVDDVGRFTAIEDLLHENLNELGSPTSRETRKFNYVVSISEPKTGFLAVDEFRSARTGLEDFPERIATRGLPALALVFHPDLRDNFQITCEGLGQWHGQATWLLHFLQRPDRPNHFRNYSIGGQLYPINIKGRAWVTADKFHIVHIESELVSPMPEIQLLSEHYIVDYGPVQFQKKDVQLWLPKTAELYFHFQRHRYFRRHSFDDFMLFSVDSDQKTSQPSAKNEKHGPASREWRGTSGGFTTATLRQHSSPGSSLSE
jgi:tetratricopeptide (TPR) repeat protein